MSFSEWADKQFSTKKKTRFPIETKYPIEEAFEIDGIKYYQFKEDLTTIPTERFFGALTVYNEMEMKVDYDYLKIHTRAMDKILNTNPISITAITTLNNTLKERLDLMCMPDYVYKLAAVLYFDDTEQPLTYDHDYAQTKIAKWKANKEVLPFFLRGPIKKLIPYLDLLPENLNLYSTIIKGITEIHQKRVSEILSAK